MDDVHDDSARHDVPQGSLQDHHWEKMLAENDPYRAPLSMINVGELTWPHAGTSTTSPHPNPGEFRADVLGLYDNAPQMISEETQATDTGKPQVTQQPASHGHAFRDEGGSDGGHTSDDLPYMHSSRPGTAFTAVNIPQNNQRPSSFPPTRADAPAAVLIPDQLSASPGQFGDDESPQDTDSEESDSLFRPERPSLNEPRLGYGNLSKSFDPVNSPPTTGATTHPETSVTHGSMQKSPASASPAVRHFHVYVREGGQGTLSYTVQLSKPGRLGDFDGVSEVYNKALRDALANSAWYTDVSQLFWSKVMEYNVDILPPNAELREKVHKLLCRSKMLIEDLWTAHQVYKSMLLKNSWNSNGEPSLLRLKYWMTREVENSRWQTTLDAKTTEYERLVPWISREWLIALCILLRKGHPDENLTVGRNGEPLPKSNIKGTKSAARKKRDLIGDCHLLYQCQDADIDPKPSAYWTDFQQALDASHVKIWNEESVADHKAGDRAAKSSYHDAENRQPNSRQDRGGSVAASVDSNVQDRVLQLETEVAQLRDYVHNMHTHLSPRLQDLPDPPWL